MRLFSLSSLAALGFLFSNFAWANSVVCSFGSEFIYSKPYDSGPIELPEDGAKIHVFAVYKNGSIAYLDEKEYLKSGLASHAEISIDITEDGIRYDGRNGLDDVSGKGYVPFVRNKKGQYEAYPTDYVFNYFRGNSLGLRCVQSEPKSAPPLRSQLLNRKFKVVGCKGSYEPSSEALFHHNRIRTGTTIKMVSITPASTIFEIDSTLVELRNFHIFGKSGHGREQINGVSHETPNGFEYNSSYFIESSSESRNGRTNVEFAPNPANAQKWQLRPSTIRDHDSEKNFLRLSAICDLEEVL
ncbi:MAG: hypothetical protein KF799_12855 [Bdellovibrionales bacterium]|nr:hypothetical protein [Bdellovibrionales bacterium]